MDDAKISFFNYKSKWQNQANYTKRTFTQTRRQKLHLKGKIILPQKTYRNSFAIIT